MDEKDKQQEKVWSAFSLAMNLGYMITIPIILFGGGGILLDKKAGSFPIFSLVGFVLAMAIGLYIVYEKTKDIISTGNTKK